MALSVTCHGGGVVFSLQEEPQQPHCLELAPELAQLPLPDHSQEYRTKRRDPAKARVYIRPTAWIAWMGAADPGKVLTLKPQRNEGGVSSRQLSKAVPEDSSPKETHPSFREGKRGRASVRKQDRCGPIEDQGG